MLRLSAHAFIFTLTLSLLFFASAPFIKAAPAEILDEELYEVNTGGTVFTNIGDIDANGVDDYAIGDRYDEDGGVRRGAIYIVLLEAEGVVGSVQKISDTAGDFTADLDDNDFFGSCIGLVGYTPGEHTGPTLVVGARGDDDGGDRRGAVYILFLNEDGKVHSYQKISDTAGDFSTSLSDGDAFGTSCDGIGYLDGDEMPDIVVGASTFARELPFGGEGDEPLFDNPGAVHVIFLNENGTVKGTQKIANDGEVADGDLSVTFVDEDKFGDKVRGMGDINGDGNFDVMVSAWSDGGADNVYIRSYLLFLGSDGKVDDVVPFVGGDFGLIDVTRPGWSVSLSSVKSISWINDDIMPDIAFVLNYYEDEDPWGAETRILILFMGADGEPISYREITLDDIDTDLDGAAFFDIETAGFFSDDAWRDAAVYLDNGDILILTLDGGSLGGDDDDDDGPGGSSSSGSIIAPKNTSLTSSGSCTSSGKVIVQLSGQNIRDIAVSESEYFHGAQWVLFEPNAQGVMQYEVAFSDLSGTKTIYALFRSASHNLSPVHSITVNLADGCDVSGGEEDDDELLGGLVKTADSPAVYYVEETEDGLVRRPFFNEAIYFTYFNDFDRVIEISFEEMAAIPMGDLMLPKAGDAMLLKFTYNSKVYAIVKGDTTSQPVLRHIPDEQKAVELFGGDWNKIILELPDWISVRANIGLPL